MYGSLLPLLHLVNFPWEKSNSMANMNLLFFITLHIANVLNDNLDVASKYTACETLLKQKISPMMLWSEQNYFLLQF